MSGTQDGVTHFFMPFSRVSRTRVEASLTYVLVEVPLIPEASLRLDRLDCSGTDKYAARQKRFLFNASTLDKKTKQRNATKKGR